ncbi:MAG: 4-hydroxy-tetrahydrodipicolinate synthase [Candidatus Omnitrophica bacterium]|nr:4-hydroxy-tetrahydrodipicolinate synthase [Candidatus Omnitrophota bacterium]
MFEGSIVALVTPFKNGKVDEEKLRELVEFHIKNGTSGIVPCGTTGESATLTHDEHNRVIEVVIEAAKKRIKIIAGTGSNSTAEAIDLTRYAEKAGADAALLLSPYYNKPTQRGLYMHYKAIADSVKIPIIPYNIQSRTAVNIEPETFQKLAQIKNIVGVKESSGNLEQISRIRMLCGPNFEIISGDDALTLPIMAVGGVGVISVVANIVPRDVADLVAAFRSGDVKKAQELHYKLLPLVKAMFIETNPIPVKTAMELVGMLEPELRLPLCHMSEENLAKLAEAVKKYGL